MPWAWGIQELSPGRAGVLRSGIDAPPRACRISQTVDWEIE